MSDRLDKKFDVLIENDVISLELSRIIKDNIKHKPRPYQIEAFSRFNFYVNDYKKRMLPTKLLFHMATGSGKTLIMAGAVLELFRLGYNNFIFFVNSDTIIKKTKENFLNPESNKYLFNQIINIDGKNILINEVDNFEAVNENEINIVFTTIQGLHSRLNNPKENAITFDDFIDKKIVLLSDEAHHINTITKSQRELSLTEREINSSWETSIKRIFNSSSTNIMLEFTATIELHNPKVAAKYNNRLLFDYDLVKFREDKYSKEVMTNQIDLEPKDRLLIGPIISQYKKKVFANNNKIIKPVILMKSKTVNGSLEMEKLFAKKIKDLKIKDLEEISSSSSKLIRKAFDYFENNNISLQNLVDEIKEDFSEEKTISVNSKNDSIEKQIIINTLEDKDNEYRVIFAVDKLNEGWDVLNLFDIVRLYDTRDADYRVGKLGRTTINEAQLIGRGARYCPFKLTEEQEIDKRKYDDDYDNPLRICETLNYHCSHNPRYISELHMALKEIGIMAHEQSVVKLILKDDFKKTSLYKNGFIHLNNKVENNPKIFNYYREPEIKKSFNISLKTSQVDDRTIFDETDFEINNFQRISQEHALINWEKTIIKKAINQIPFYYFNNLVKFFPSINSIDDFITNNKYLGKVKVSVSGLVKDVKNINRKNKLNISKKILIQISEEINKNFGEFIGTKTFKPVPIKKIFKDKKLNFSVTPYKEIGRPTMRKDIRESLKINLDEKDWYVYNENYGSSEEKFLVKFVDSKMDDLKKKFNQIYLVRNERHFKLFRFSDGKATEPDFVMFMKNKESNNKIIYQLFIEPKGEHLLETDRWKENFLKSLEEEAKVEIFANKKFKLFGMPFYNESITKSIFSDKVDEIIN